MLNILHPKNQADLQASMLYGYSNITDTSNALRKASQEKMYNYYAGLRPELKSYLLSALKKTWGDDTVASMPLSILNITEKIINQIAIIYKKPARRTIYVDGKVDDELTAYYNSILPKDVNKADKLAHRLTRLQNTTLPHITYNADTQTFKQNTLSSSLYTVDVDDNDVLTPIKVSFTKFFTINDDPPRPFTVIYTADRMYMKDGNGNEYTLPGYNTTDNPFGLIPFITYRLVEYNDFWGEGSDILIEENEIINVLLSKLNYDDIILGTAGALFGINLGSISQANEDGKTSTVDSTRNVKGGRSNIINVEAKSYQSNVTPDLKYVATNPQIKQVMDAIDWKIQTLAKMYGLNPNSFSSSSNAQSGVSRTAAMFEQTEMREEDRDACMKYEQDRFNIIRKMNNVLESGDFQDTDKLKHLPDTCELVVDFIESPIPMDSNDMWRDRSSREARGMASPIDFLLEDNPDIRDRDKAKEVIRKNLEYNKENGIVSDGQVLTNDAKNKYDDNYVDRNEKLLQDKKNQTN